MGVGPSSERTRVRRAPQKARYDVETVHAIIDAVAFCHVAVAEPGMPPLAMPFLHARCGSTVYLHGSRSNRTLGALVDAERVAVTFTTFEGLRVARTGFHSSVTYRSVVAFGRCRRVDDDEELRAALDAVVEALLPGRTAEIRAPNDRELALTVVVAFEIDEASAKVSKGPTEDDDDDVHSPVWAGDVPLVARYATPIGATDGAMADGSVPVPESVRRLLGP